jgi:hypothetical protein
MQRIQVKKIGIMSDIHGLLQEIIESQGIKWKELIQIKECIENIAHNNNNLRFNFINPKIANTIN